MRNTCSTDWMCKMHTLKSHQQRLFADIRLLSCGPPSTDKLAYIFIPHTCVVTCIFIFSRRRICCCNKRAAPTWTRIYILLENTDPDSSRHSFFFDVEIGCSFTPHQQYHTRKCMYTYVFLYIPSEEQQTNSIRRDMVVVGEEKYVANIRWKKEIRVLLLGASLPPPATLISLWSQKWTNARCLLACSSLTNSSDKRIFIVNHLHNSDTPSPLCNIYVCSYIIK